MRTQLLALALVAALLLCHASAQTPAEQCFPETGKCIKGSFLTYWQANGGLRQQGLPITNEFQENGLTVQYFERARFEYHPEFAGSPNEVLLGLLGREQYTAKYETPPPVSPITLKGTGTMNTAQFTLAAGTYKANWRSEVKPDSTSCFHAADLRTAADAHVEYIGNDSPKPGAPVTGETFIYNVKAGPHFISANSGCVWSITLTHQP